MAVQVYVISDHLAIDFIQNEDLEGFKEYLDSDDTIISPNRKNLPLRPKLSLTAPA